MAAFRLALSETVRLAMFSSDLSSGRMLQIWTSTFAPGSIPAIDMS